jgi:sugar/nucleoside kinase (ribokinase family)
MELGVPEACAPITVIKNGENGAQARSKLDKNWTHAGISAPVTVRDATGAGDAFNAGFLSCWLEQKSLQECLMSGNARGALAVRVVGGIGVPS